MTVKEYLHQAYRLDQRIKSDTMEAQNLREMAGSVSAIQYDKDRVQASAPPRRKSTTRSTHSAASSCDLASSETSIKQSARFSLRISLATPAGRTAHRKRRWQHANDHERAA